MMIITEATYLNAIRNIRSFTSYKPPLYEFVGADTFKHIPEDVRVSWYMDNKAGTIIQNLAGPNFRTMWEVYRINGDIKCPT